MHPIASMIAAIVVAAASPAPTPPPEIVHTVTSEQCTALRTMALPIGYVAKRNDLAFGAMARNTIEFLEGIDPKDVPTQAELQQALDQQGWMGQTSSQATGEETQDDQLLYGPKQVIKAASVDRIAQEIYANLGVEADYMKQSWHDFPQGHDPQIDALRQRLQNLMDLQRGLADRYETFAGTYLSGQGMSQMLASGDRQSFKAYLRALVLGDIGTLAGEESGQPPTEYDSVGDLAKNGNPAEVIQALIAEERAFAATVIPTYNHCNGTTMILKPDASPSPHPH
jgi:hypothetical protein